MNRVIDWVKKFCWVAVRVEEFSDSEATGNSRFSAVFLVNGFGRRKIKIYGGDRFWYDPKHTRFYAAVIVPWLNGVDPKSDDAIPKNSSAPERLLT